MTGWLLPLAAAAGNEPTTLGPLRGALVVFLLAIGSFFLLVGTIGLIRLPDVYNRMHATSKATTLGASSMFLGAVAFFGPQNAGLTAIIGIVFLFLTAPTGAHMISRAAEKMGVPFAGDVTWPADRNENGNGDMNENENGGHNDHDRSQGGDD